MKRFLALSFLLAPCFAQTIPPLLLRSPALGKTRSRFSPAGDLWSVPREGGEATRPNGRAGNRSRPRYFPRMVQEVAFSGEYEGNVDVYVVSAGGGVPAAAVLPSGARHSRRVVARRAKTSSFRSNREESFAVHQTLLRFQPMVVFRSLCRCHPASWELSRRIRRALPTCRSFPPIRSGSAIEVAAHHAHLDCQARRFVGHQDPQLQLQRLQSLMGWWQSRLSIGSQRPHYALLLRSRQWQSAADLAQ